MLETGVKFFWIFSNALLAITYAIAWYRGPLSRFTPAFNHLELHFVTSIPTTLFHFFTGLAVLFYFIGTGVWIKDEAMSLAKTDRAKAEKIFEVYKKANKLKGRAFPFITFSTFFGIMTFVLGGARHVRATPPWVHPTVGTILLVVSIISLPFIFAAIDKNVNYLNEATALLDEK